MKEWTELFRVTADLLWPVFAFSLFFYFRKEIKLLLGRIKRGKLFGQEIELDEPLKELKESVDAAVIEVTALQVKASEKTGLNGDKTRTLIDKVVQDATQSPKTALLNLSIEIERQLWRLLASIGLLPENRGVSFGQAIDMLNEREALPKSLANSIQLFRDVRNRIVHGRNATDDDVIRAIDSGITILKALEAVPHPIKVVVHPGVDVYSDSECKNLIPNAKGVILQSESISGLSKTQEIYPTTRTHFEKGKRVSWDWNFKKEFREAWYRDPDTNEIKYGWGSSVEFIGHHLDEI